MATKTPLLPGNWIIQEPIDHEHKTYLIQSFLNRIVHGFEYGLVHPYHDELVFHFRILKNLAKNQDFKTTLSVPMRLRPMDIEEDMERFKELCKNEKLKAELDKTIEWATGLFEKTIYRSLATIDSLKDEFEYRILQGGGKLELGTLVVHSPIDGALESCTYSMPLIKVGGKDMRSTIVGPFKTMTMPKNSKFSLEDLIMKKLGTSQTVLFCTVSNYIALDQREYLSKRFAVEYVESKLAPGSDDDADFKFPANPNP